MATKGISEAFAKYGARLKNVNWSVSAWNSVGELVLSLWAHHYRRGEDGSAEYFGKLSTWAGPGNNELRANISDAFERGSYSSEATLAHLAEEMYLPDDKTRRRASSSRR